jgi:hypothetical protein
MDTMNRIIRRSLIVVGSVVIVVLLSWLYTTVQLANARSKGVYPSAEQGMLARLDKYYMPDREMEILYAGTNSFDGSNPHVWYVIAEVHASARADGSALSHNGCDSPGSFFLQTKDGNWVYVSEGAFPGFMGFWMKVFDMAGEGQAEPSIDWAADQPSQFCR